MYLWGSLIAIHFLEPAYIVPTVSLAGAFHSRLTEPSPAFDNQAFGAS